MIVSALSSRAGRAVSLVSAAILSLALAGGTAAVAAPARGHGPVGRVWTSWVYDPALHEGVLFGGDRGYRHRPRVDTVLGTTWTWKGGAWSRRHPGTSPSARTGAAMVYDGATGQLLLFGGTSKPSSGGGFDNQTWVWTGTTWRQRHPATSPPPRAYADLVYDAARHEVILFGGFDGVNYLNDTWAWDGTAWTQLHPATSPPPRDGDSLVYDPATQTTIMVGGWFSTHFVSDTWSWDGTTWTQLSPPQSPGGISIAWQAGYDSASQQLLLFGGDNNGAFSFKDGTWAWDGTTWTRLQPATHPGSRAYGSMTYDPDLQRLVLYAGSNTRTDLTAIWEWNGTTWQRG